LGVKAGRLLEIMERMNLGRNRVLTMTDMGYEKWDVGYGKSVIQDTWDSME
jgi:hypothetical protein